MDHYSVSGSSHGPNESYTLDERRRAALEEIDRVKFSWFHFKVCMVAGIGFFTDAYDIFAITLASKMLGFADGKDGKLSHHQDLALKAATTIGTLVGQLFFGWLADRLGRKRVYGFELLVMVVSTFTQALAGGATAVNIISVLILWRFLMGVGIGGDYPLSAIIVSEFSPIAIRGRLMTVVVAFQGWGAFSAALVALAAVEAYKPHLLKETPANAPSTDYMWRIIIGLGCVPAVAGFYFRLTIPETPRFTMDIGRNLDQAVADIDMSLSRGNIHYNSDVIRRVSVPKASWRDFARYFGQWRNFKGLFGASYAWFAIDAAFYGLGLNSDTFLEFLFPVPAGGASNVYQTLHNFSVFQLVTTVGGLIPGYWATFLFVDSWGRKPIQLGGFCILTLIFIAMGPALDKLTATTAGRKATFSLYCIANFFQNFGPNTTTFLIPGEIFPTRYRSTCHGIAAASGKLGATVALVIFSELQRHPKPLNRMLDILIFFMVTGIGSTLLLPETKGKSLEDLSNESQQGFVLGYGDHRHQMRLLG